MQFCQFGFTIFLWPS